MIMLYTVREKHSTTTGITKASLLHFYCEIDSFAAPPEKIELFFNNKTIVSVLEYSFRLTAFDW